MVEKDLYKVVAGTLRRSCGTPELQFHREMDFSRPINGFDRTSFYKLRNLQCTSKENGNIEGACSTRLTRTFRFRGVGDTISERNLGVRRNVKGSI